MSTGLSIHALFTYSTVTKGGIENGARLARQEPFSDSCPTAASRTITSLRLSPGLRSRARLSTRRDSSQIRRSPLALASGSQPTLRSGRVATMALKASAVIAMRARRLHRRIHVAGADRHRLQDPTPDD